MDKLRLKVASIGRSILFAIPLAAQVSPTMPKAERVRIMQGPELESCNDYLTIIRWTTNNPGGSPVHYGIVHYGIKPNELNQTAKSPIRMNPDHSSTIFRVRMEGLQAGVTYYYTVESEGSNRTSDGGKSSTKRFTVSPQTRDASPPQPCR